VLLGGARQGRRLAHTAKAGEAGSRRVLWGGAGLPACGRGKVWLGQSQGGCCMGSGESGWPVRGEQGAGAQESGGRVEE
jgi:hypothetical protein